MYGVNSTGEKNSSLLYTIHNIKTFWHTSVLFHFYQMGSIARNKHDKESNDNRWNLIFKKYLEYLVVSNSINSIACIYQTTIYIFIPIEIIAYGLFQE